MTIENKNDFYKLIFSQREDKVPLPEPMQLQHIPHKFRKAIWSSISSEISENETDCSTDTGYNYYGFSTERNIGTILHSYHDIILQKYHDDIPDFTNTRNCLSFYRELIRDGNGDKNYHEVLTLIEFMLRHEACPENLRKGFVDAFDKTPIAYFVEEIGGFSTIVPRTSHEAGEATRQAIVAIQQTGLRGASTHLRQATEHINAQQYADSIADSIHAVESVARIITEKNTLSPALDSLEQAGLLKHTALKEAFKNLYGYTSDEQGIRHALLHKDSPDVGLDEAVFMFGACASFAAYLANKHRQMEQQQGSVE